ncbi:MAG TPA: PIG-L family deacetylase [Polyangiales bacterium]
MLQLRTARAEPGDDRYRFERARHSDIVLQLAPQGASFVWSQPGGRWDTALLAIRVEHAAPAPQIAITAGPARVVQFLDEGAAGLRWLNLTSLASALRPGEPVSLEARGVRIAAASAQLALFDNGLPAKPRVLVLAPHPDDAEIAAFALYASHAARATIATITAGNGGFASYQASFAGDVAGQYLFKGTLRTIDSVSVPWLGGVPPQRCVNLGYFDEQLEAMHASPRAPVREAYRDNRDVGVYRRFNLSSLVPRGAREARWDHLVQDLTSLLRKVQPQLLVAPHPQLDSHADHAFTTVALSEALARAGLPVRVLLYTNHADSDRYPYGPAGSVMSLPPSRTDELVIPGVYALPVPAALVRQKSFALEAMHDLRPAPQLAPGESRELSDYLRRAPRSEELFYVYDRAGLRALVHAFLAARAATPSPR